jgi:hypothetical protein
VADVRDQAVTSPCTPERAHHGGRLEAIRGGPARGCFGP